MNENVGSILGLLSIKGESTYLEAKRLDPKHTLPNYVNYYLVGRCFRFEFPIPCPDSHVSNDRIVNEDLNLELRRYLQKWWMKQKKLDSKSKAKIEFQKRPEKQTPKAKKKRKNKYWTQKKKARYDRW